MRSPRITARPAFPMWPAATASRWPMSASASGRRPAAPTRSCSRSTGWRRPPVCCAAATGTSSRSSPMSATRTPAISTACSMSATAKAPASTARAAPSAPAPRPEPQDQDAPKGVPCLRDAFWCLCQGESPGLLKSCMI